MCKDNQYSWTSTFQYCAGTPCTAGQPPRTPQWELRDRGRWWTCSKERGTSTAGSQLLSLNSISSTLHCCCTLHNTVHSATMFTPQHYTLHNTVHCTILQGISFTQPRHWKLDAGEGRKMQFENLCLYSLWLACSDSHIPSTRDSWPLHKCCFMQWMLHPLQYVT